MEILLPIFYTVLIIAIINRWRFFQLEGVSKAWINIAFLLKVVAGLALWFLYTHIYQNPDESDALRYFEDAMTIKKLWWENREVFWSFMTGQGTDNPQYADIYDKLVGWTSGYRYGLTNDCSTIIRINVVLGFISGENYHVHAIVMSWMGFFGLTAIYKTLHSLKLTSPRLLYICLFLLPSVLFWSSGLLKEGPLFFALGLLIYGLGIVNTNAKNPAAYFVIALSAVMLIYIKEYVLFSLIPALLFLILVKLSGNRLIWIKFILLHLLLFAAAENARYFFQGGDFIYVLHKKQVDFQNVALLTDAGSAIELPPVTDALHFALNYPAAFVTTFFRPFLWESKNWMYAAFAVENSIYILSVIAMILFFRKPVASARPALLAMLSFVLVFSSIIGSCVPILGALVRYRIVALPFLIILLLSLTDQDKLRNAVMKLSGRNS